MFHPLWATLTTIGMGAVSWIIVAMLGGRREAWDSELYFAALPVIGLTAGLISYFVPMYESGGAGAAVLPLGLIVFAIFGAFCMIPATIGAVAGRKAATAKAVAS
jgi:hypothetical protein